MIKTEITIINKYGIHTRAAAKLVECAKHYLSKIELVNARHRADCKSIMQLITLGAKKSTAFELIVDGKDEKKASEAVVKLIKDCFGEEE